jgi:hypothetical protein
MKTKPTLTVLLVGMFLAILAVAQTITPPVAQAPVSSSKQQQETKSIPKTARASEVYRQVDREDGIRFYSRAASVELLPDGSLHQEGFECGVIGDDGKEIRIALVSTTIDHGQIKTKDFGILKQKMASNNAAQLFAMESQIKQLRALQSSSTNRLQ